MQPVHSRLSSRARAMDAAGVFPCCIGVVLLALGSRVIARGTRRSPQRTALGAARVVCVAAPATPIVPGRKAACATGDARGQDGLHGSGANRPSEVAAPVAELPELVAPVVSLPAVTTRTFAVNSFARVQQTATVGERPREHRRGAAFTGATAAGGAERRQRRRLGAKLQRSAFAPRVESYDPSRLRTAIQAGQQRANSLRVSNGREWESSGTSGSTVCRALSATSDRCFVIIAGHRRDEHET